VRDILLQIEQLNKENFDNFIDLLSRCRESNKTHSFDVPVINRLKEDACSINPKYEAYLGKIGLDWVAYAIIIMSYSTFMALPDLSVEEIYVLDNYRNLGIGAAMLKLCVRRAKKKGCGNVNLVVPVGNKKSKIFFEFNGSVPTNYISYKIDPYASKIGKSAGKLTYADFIRKKNTTKFSRLNSAK
jgi:ribosomal protein S18 acetylase RimI-like enzyme